jgi:hypothetical protein
LDHSFWFLVSSFWFLVSSFWFAILSWAKNELRLAFQSIF